MTTEPIDRPSHSRPSGRLRRGAVLVLGLIVAQFALYAPSLLGRRILLPLELLHDPGTLTGVASAGSILPHDRLLTDPITQIEPMRRFAVGEVRSGRIPLWDPYNYCGAPFLAANQGGVFSPYRLLDYAWPDPWALAWGQMLRALVAGIGAYLFFRRAMGAHVWAATIGAWIWPHGGFLVLWTMWPLGAAATWLPWVMLGVNRCAQRPGAGSIALLAVASAFAIVSGHSATGAHVLLGSGIYALWVLWRAWFESGPSPNPLSPRRLSGLEFRAKGTKRPLVAAGSLLLGWLMGFCLAAPQLLPTLEYMRTSLRMANRLESGAEIAPVGLLSLPQMLLPWVHGSTRSGSIYLLPDNPLESAIAGYVGAVTVLVLAPLGFVDRRRRMEQVFWLILAALAAAYVLNLPGGWWLNRLPVLQSLRGNRMIFLSGFALLATGVAGMDVILRGRMTRSAWLLVGPGLSLALAGWCVWRGIGMSDIIAPLVAPALQSMQSRTAMDAVMGLIDRFRMLEFTYAAICVGAAGLGVILWRWPIPKAAIGVGMIALVEVVASAWSVNPQSDRALYDWDLPALEAIARSEPGRICGVLCLPPMLNRWAGLPDIRGYDAADPLRYVQVLQLLAAPESPPPDPSAATYALLPRIPLPPLADFMNLRYLIGRGAPPDPTIAKFITPGFFVIEHTSALPRATVPRGAVIIPDEARRLQMLGDGSFDPRQTVVLETDVAVPPAPTEGSVVIVSESPSRVEIDYTLSADGFVVLADTWDAGWRATVNGEPTEVLRANHAFRAVAVAAGSGRIVFSYWPRSLTLGLVLAAAGGIALIVIAGITVERRQEMVVDSIEIEPSGDTR